MYFYNCDECHKTEFRNAGRHYAWCHCADCHVAMVLTSRGVSFKMETVIGILDNFQRQYWCLGNFSQMRPRACHKFLDREEKE